VIAGSRSLRNAGLASHAAPYARSISPDLRPTVGRLGEELAAQHLQRLGFDVVARNYRTRFGELDLIAYDGRTIVFCEVKTRRAGGFPFESLHDRKRHQVRRMGAEWLARETERPRGAELRFDAIGVTLGRRPGAPPQLEHIEGAF
jgi:putative endonuclease